MKTTTASGWSLATWLVESLPQSTSAVLEIPVARWGSRITLTPSGARRRAISVSSGVESESPVTSSVCSGCFCAGCSPRVSGSKFSGVAGGTLAVAKAGKFPAPK